MVDVGAGEKKAIGGQGQERRGQEVVQLQILEKDAV